MIKMKKVLSLVLAFVMCVSLFANWPMPAFATEGGEPPVVEATAEPTVEPTIEPTVEPTIVPIVEPVVEEPAEDKVQILYNALIACNSLNEIKSVAETLTESEDEEFLAALTEDQMNAFENHLIALYEKEYPKAEKIEKTSERIFPTVDNTDAAPFGAPVTGPSLMRLFAARAAEPDNGLEVNKTVSAPDKDGVYTITLEAWATSAKTIVEETTAVPTDIILVLDQSGSMAYDFTVTGVPTEFNSTNPEDHYKQRMNSLLVKLNDGSYASVIVEKSIEIENPVSYSGKSNSTYHNNSGNFYHLCSDGTYGIVEVNLVNLVLVQFYSYTCQNCGESSYGTTGLGFWDINSPDNDNEFYTASSATVKYTFSYVDENGNTVSYGPSATVPEGWKFYIAAANTSSTRLLALKNAVTTFTNNVKAKAEEDNVDHRIAIVGFASVSGNGNNSEILTLAGDNSGSVGVSYAALTEDDSKYVGALQDMSTTAGQNMVNSAIAALAAEGATRVDIGMEMANKVFEKNPVPSGETRNRVIVVFTDGVPTTSNSYSETVANSAISYGSTAKSTYGATVYTVGIFDGADSSKDGNSNGNETQKANWFMHRLSSNTTYPRSPSYYLTANDSDSLNKIFQEISDNIETGGSSITLDEEAVVKDVISDQFTLPKDADISDIKVYTANYTAADTFTNKTAYNATVAISSDKKTISVTNFDFAENWVGTETTNGNVTYHGKKLIIEIPVKVRDGFLGGNNVLTNGAGSGVYENADAAEPLEGFVSPKVDVEIGEVKVTAPDWNVYLLGSVSADEIEDSLTVTVGGKALNMKADNYGLANWQTAYVSFDEQAGYNNLVEDKNFTATFTVTPKETGTVKAKSGSATAKINVFKPEVTFNDVNAYQGASVPVLENLQDSVVWKHDDKLSTAVTMTGTEPRLNHTYTPAKSGVITGTEDIKVDVTTKIGENDVTTHVTYSDKPVIYVFSPEVTYKDLGVYLGNALPTDEQLATAVEKVEWKNETLGVAKAADMGDAPVLTHTFGYKDTIESVNTNADIPVNDIIKAGETTITPFAVLHTNCGGKDTEERAADYEFELHVLTPVITFQDSQIQLGHTPVYENENLVRVEWTHPEFADTAIGDKPTLGYKYSPAADAFTVDTPVKVTVNVGSTDITGFVKFYRDACSLNGCTNTTKTEVSATDGNRVNFVVHIKCADLTITKQAGENTVFAENETFMFKVTGPNNYSTIVVIEGAGSAIIKNLPVGTYTVTELTDWSWRYTVDDAKKECDLSSPNGRYVTFTNTISNPYWLDGNDYKENVFNQ